MNKSIDLVYVVASKLGSIGMGTTAYQAIKGVDKSKKLSYNIFCRGYKKVLLNKDNIKSVGYLEYLSLPLRFIEKKLYLKINPFKYINLFFGNFVKRNLPVCKIYHTWVGIAPEAILKAKRNGAILILEGANSHPITSSCIMNYEFRKYGQKDNIIDIKAIRKSSNIYNLFDYVMCPSDFVYDSFLKQGFKKNQLIKIPYGVNPNRFRPLKEKKTNEKIKFLFVGSIQLRKGIQYLLQAWDELKLQNAELIIVGRVWPDARSVVEKYTGNSSIKFIGFMLDPIKLFQSSDVFISTSLEEGSALTCYEAMACGLPLIATTNTGSVLRNNKDGFVIPIRDVNAIKKKILYFHDNSDEIKRMGRNARKYIKKFTWEKYGEKLNSTYEKIIT